MGAKIALFCLLLSLLGSMCVFITFVKRNCGLRADIPSSIPLLSPLALLADVTHYAILALLRTQILWIRWIFMADLFYFNNFV